MRYQIRHVLIAAALSLLASPAVAGPREAGERLLKAYPEALASSDGTMIVWRDGTRMPIDDGRGVKPLEARLADPDLEDMLAVPYPAGPVSSPPAPDGDPGRARNAGFFNRMYGDCRKGEVAGHLVEIIWLPHKAAQRIRVTAVNGVAEKLAAISRELDQLPSRLDAFLVPSAGTYNCRPVAGTGRPSAHGYGIAIDIATRHSDYWRWSKPAPDGTPVYRNAIPEEIVSVFEKHGFIWGGKWAHFDTMHFEYRPELLDQSQ
jgi:hypothetical protein